MRCTAGALSAENEHPNRLWTIGSLWGNTICLLGPGSPIKISTGNDDRLLLRCVLTMAAQDLSGRAHRLWHSVCGKAIRIKSLALS